MTTRGDPVHALAGVARAVRSAVAEIDFPLAVPSAVTAAATAGAIRGHLDDYLLPRLANLAAPLLVVVGGSTGAGKSTLVNSLVRAPVSAAGVLRPTTRAPVLVCHPSDAAWFRGQHLLGSLSRTSTAAGGAQLQVIVAPALPAGLAFLDAPDIDSVVSGNRAMAHRLFAAADLWLFVTTPNRYADAVPWQLLHHARARAAVVALVLARVPEAVNAELVSLVSDLLTAQGLSQLPVFVVPETKLDRQGLLPEPATARLRAWFDALAGDQPARASVARCTLDGAVAALPAQLTMLATALEEQAAVAERLAEQVGLAYGLARGTVERGLRNGALGPAGATGGSARHRRSAGESALAKLVHSAVADAAEQTESVWRTHPAGRVLLAGSAPGPSADLLRQVQRAVREQPDGGVLHRIEQLLDAEAAGWLDRLAGVPHGAGAAKRLRELAVELERARLAAQLPVMSQPATPAEDTSAGDTSAGDTAADVAIGKAGAGQTAGEGADEPVRGEATGTAAEKAAAAEPPAEAKEPPADAPARAGDAAEPAEPPAGAEPEVVG